MEAAEILIKLAQSFNKKQMAFFIILFPLSKWGQMFRKLSANISPCFSSISKKHCKYDFYKTGIPQRVLTCPLLVSCQCLAARSHFLPLMLLCCVARCQITSFPGACACIQIVSGHTEPSVPKYRFEGFEVFKRQAGPPWIYRRHLTHL